MRGDDVAFRLELLSYLALLSMMWCNFPTATIIYNQLCNTTSGFVHRLMSQVDRFLYCKSSSIIQISPNSPASHIVSLIIVLYCVVDHGKKWWGICMLKGSCISRSRIPSYILTPATA